NMQEWVSSDSSGNQKLMSRTKSTSDAFHKVDLVYVQGVKTQFYMDGILDATSTTNLHTGIIYARISSGNYHGGNQIYLKWVCIRKYNATPPIITVDPTVYNYQSANSTSNVTSGSAPLITSQPVANEKFTIEVKPPEGAVLTFSRTLPPSIVSGEYYPVY
ncbi:MAG TPA: hypothetical protein VFE71_05530, partial [Bacteroidales bacterium]|nr:hypothetical protein [Bacteroidales bacterium]